MDSCRVSRGLHSQNSNTSRWKNMLEKTTQKTVRKTFFLKKIAKKFAQKKKRHYFCVKITRYKIWKKKKPIVTNIRTLR